MGNKKIKEDRFLQEFILFIENEVKQYINDFRERRAINPEKSFTTIKDWEETFAISKNIRDKKYIELNKSIGILLEKVSDNDVKEMLKDFKKPISWLFPLRWYILTGKVIPPSSRCKVDIDGDEEVIIRISAEANIRDIRNIYKLIPQIQEQLVGNDFKKKRIKKKLSSHLSEAKDYAEYKKIKRKTFKKFDSATREYYTTDNKQDRKLELVEKHNPEAIDDAELQRREEARLRQVYKRHKEYI